MPTFRVAYRVIWPQQGSVTCWHYEQLPSEQEAIAAVTILASVLAVCRQGSYAIGRVERVG
jgi:hypothetical protein